MPRRLLVSLVIIACLLAAGAAFAASPKYNADRAEGEAWFLRANADARSSLWVNPAGRPQVQITGTSLQPVDPRDAGAAEYPVFPVAHGRGVDSGFSEAPAGAGSPTFTFAPYADAAPSTPAPASYECVLIGGAARSTSDGSLRLAGDAREIEPTASDTWTPCASGVRFTGLRTTQMTYVFAVRGVGANGRRGRPTSYRWSHRDSAQP